MSEIMGKRLRALRDKSGLSQKFVAEKVGVKNNTLSGYESGNREPDSEILTKLADFYDVTTDYLHGRVSDPKGYSIEDNESFDSLEEINKLVKEFNIEQLGFFDIEKWKNFTPEDIDELRRHFEWVAQKAKERNEEK